MLNLQTAQLSDAADNDGNDWLPPGDHSLDSQPILPSSVGKPKYHSGADAEVKKEFTCEQDWLVAAIGPRSPKQVSKEELLKVFGSESASPSFYHYESSNPGMGAHFLVASVFKIAEPNIISEAEVKFCLNMTGLLTRLTEQERQQLANILFDAVNANNDQKSIFKQIRLPTSSEDFNKIFVSGRKSILKNIPRPVVKSTEDGTHAYVNLIDVIANMMASNLPVDRFDRTTSDVPKSTAILSGTAISGLTMAAKLETKDRATGISATLAAHVLLIELSRVQ